MLYNTYNLHFMLLALNEVSCHTLASYVISLQDLSSGILLTNSEVEQRSSLAG